MNLYILPKRSNSILKSKAMNPFRFTWVLSLLLFMTFQVASAQIQGCSLLGLDIEECLDQDENSALIDNCCKALNQAVQAGYYCLCLLQERSSIPLQGIALSLKLSNCYISVPQLTQCQKSLPVFLPPVTSAPNDSIVPFPSKRDEIPLNSTAINSSIAAGLPTSISNIHRTFDIHELGDIKPNSGDKLKTSLHPELLLPIVLYVIIK